MNYFEKIKNTINEFCKQTPENGFEINYLEEASRLLKLYDQALIVMENEEVNEKELEIIFNEMNQK